MRNNLFSIMLLKQSVQEFHTHSEPELIYVLDGKVNVEIKDKCYELSREDVILVNSSLQHSVYSESDATFCCVKFDYSLLANVLPKANSFFVCNSSIDKIRSYVEIKDLCWKLVYQETFSKKKTESLKYSLIYQILDELIEHFVLEDNTPHAEEYDAEGKLQAIIHYVHLNFREGIALSDLAKELYTSTSTLSRLFKKQTGIYFADYVNQVRVQYAAEELIYTEKAITKIAMDCGFSNASAFTKIFKEKTELSPSEYRVRMKEKLEDNVLHDEKLEKIQKTVKQDVTRIIESKKDRVIEPRKLIPSEKDSMPTITCDVRNSRAYKKSWNKAINMGSILDLTRANLQYHLQYLVQELGFSYVRIWSVFSKQLHLSDGRSLGKFNFDLMDEVLDYLVSIHVHPWLDLVRRPNANVRTAKETVWFEDDNIEFESQEVWNSLFEAMIRHFVRRYGVEEVSQWIFEIGQDFFHEDYNFNYKNESGTIFDVYDFAYDTLREFAPGAKIGYTPGPSNVREEQVIRTMTTLAEGGRTPDFIAYLLFPYVNPNQEDKNASKEFVRTFDESFEYQMIKMMRENMNRSGLKDVALYISEWNMTVSVRNVLNDSCFRGACFCRKMQEIAEEVDMLAMWLGSDWISNYFDASSIAYGGGGLITKDRIRKPIFFAMRLMNRLYDEIVASGPNYIVTKSGNNDLQVVCFNVGWYGANFFLKAEDQLKPEDLNTEFDDGGAITLNLEFEGMSENCEYIIKKRSVNNEHGNFLELWKDFDYSTSLERNDVKYLQEICIPSLGLLREKSKNGKLSVSLPLQPQEVCNLHIYMA